MIVVQYIISALIPTLIYYKMFGINSNRIKVLSISFILFFVSLGCIDYLDKSDNVLFAVLSLLISFTISLGVIPYLYHVKIRSVVLYVLIKYICTLFINIFYILFFHDFLNTETNVLIFIQETILSFISYMISYWIWYRIKYRSSFDFPWLIYIFPVIIVGLLGYYLPDPVQKTPYSPERFPLPLIGILILFVLYSVLLCLYVRKINRYYANKIFQFLLNQEQELTMKTLKNLNKRYSDIRKTQHDIKNHLMTLRILKEQNNDEEYKVYANQILSLIQEQKSKNEGRM